MSLNHCNVTSWELENDWMITICWSQISSVIINIIINMIQGKTSQNFIASQAHHLILVPAGSLKHEPEDYDMTGYTPLYNSSAGFPGEI